MKTAVSISAAMLLAMSLAACGNNDEQDSAAASEGAAPETNTASENSNAMEGSSDSQMSGESAGGSQDSMSSDDMAEDESSMSGGDAMGSATSEDMPRAAVAVLHGTEGNDGVSATIRFTPQDGGLAYTTDAEGLKPGEHGYHIHLYGDCSSGDGKSAGTHYNLKGSSKNPPKDIDHITGDLGNLDAGEDGSASDEGMIEGASLTGAKAIIGRGVIIHAKANDPSQPPIGAAGSRQACGVIGIAESESGNDSASNAGSASDSSGSSMESGSSASGSAESGSGSSMESGEEDAM